MRTSSHRTGDGRRHVTLLSGKVILDLVVYVLMVGGLCSIQVWRGSFLCSLSSYLSLRVTFSSPFHVFVLRSPFSLYVRRRRGGASRLAVVVAEQQRLRLFPRVEGGQQFVLVLGPQAHLKEHTPPPQAKTLAVSSRPHSRPHDTHGGVCVCVCGDVPLRCRGRARPGGGTRGFRSLAGSRGGCSSSRCPPG